MDVGRARVAERAAVLGRDRLRAGLAFGLVVGEGPTAVDRRRRARDPEGVRAADRVVAIPCTEEVAIERQRHPGEGGQTAEREGGARREREVAEVGGAALRRYAVRLRSVRSRWRRRNRSGRRSSPPRRRQWLRSRGSALRRCGAEHEPAWLDRSSADGSSSGSGAPPGDRAVMDRAIEARSWHGPSRSALHCVTNERHAFRRARRRACRPPP